MHERSSETEALSAQYRSTHHFDNKDAVVELLRLQERMHVLKEDLQVVAAVAVRNDDGDTVASATRERPPAPPGGEVRLLRLQLLQQRHRLVDGDTPHCRRQEDDQITSTSVATCIIKY